MMGTRNDEPSPVRFPIYLAISLLGLGIILAHALVKHRHNREMEAAKVAAEKDHKAMFVLHDAIAAARTRAILANPGRPPLPTLDPATLTVNERPLEHRVGADGNVVYWYKDPVTGGEAWIEPMPFGMLSARTGNKPGKLFDVPSRKAYQVVRRIHRLAYLLGYFAWVVLLVGFAMNVRDQSMEQSRRSLYRLLYIAILSALLSGVGFGYWRTWNTYLFGELAGVGECVILLTLALMLILRLCYTQRPTYPRCPSCHYNLTGNVSGVCPECGTPLPASSQPV